MYRNTLPHIIEKQALAGARGPRAHFEAIQKIRARMSDIDRKNADIQEEVIESRRKLKLTGNLTEKEIEEFINFQYYIGPDTVKEQLRRYFLMVKVCRPDLASKLQIELDEKIGNSIDNNLDLSIVDIAIILNKYVSGFLIRYNGSLYYKSKGELKIM